MDSRYPDRSPPHFTDINAANVEIQRLRKQLIQANEKRMQAFEKMELTKRSLVGTIRSLEAQIKILKDLKP